MKNNLNNESNYREEEKVYQIEKYLWVLYAYIQSFALVVH